MRRVLWFGLMALAWIFASPVAAQSRLFSEDAPLKIVLTAPFPTLVRAAKTSMNPYPATLTVTDGAEPAQTLPIQLRARGLTRRTAGFCDFPPIQLQFGDKSTLKGTVFKGQHHLKLVTYCRDHADFEQRIMLEYMTYRLYNLITPMSYRVRAAEVTYRTSDKDAGVTRFGFLIEELGELADRNHVKRLTLASHQIKATQFDAHAAGRAALFEYMIGNLDWDFLAGPAGAECCHNARFVAQQDKAPLSGVIPIAYDFDFSGLVDSPYAGPPEGLPVNTLQQRLYRGYCASSDEIPSVVAEFQSHRAAIMALIDAEPRLTPNFRSKTRRFLDGFFQTLDDPARVQSLIIKHCRSRPHASLSSTSDRAASPASRSGRGRRSRRGRPSARRRTRRRPRDGRGRRWSAHRPP